MNLFILNDKTHLDYNRIFNNMMTRTFPLYQQKTLEESREDKMMIKYKGKLANSLNY